MKGSIQRRTLEDGLRLKVHVPSASRTRYLANLGVFQVLVLSVFDRHREHGIVASKGEKTLSHRDWYRSLAHRACARYSQAVRVAISSN
ncbi:MAG: hypothetical protein WBQ79_18510, partial [Acidobacteriaceae bacterium]